MIVVRVPGSTSNLGAGFDCVGLALDLWLSARLVLRTGSDGYHGTLKGLEPAADIVRRVIGDQLPDEARLELHSTIPVSRGLGSSAAAVVAGIAIRRSLRGEGLDRATMFWEAAQEEGHPDNAGPSVYGGLILAVDRPVQLVLDPEIGIALAVPRMELDTSAARNILPTALPRDTAIGQGSRNAALLLGLTTGDADLIAVGMDDRIAVPHRKNLIVGFDSAVTAGRAAGAFGVTISGSGSSLVAMAPKSVAQHVATEMARALTDADNPATPMTPAVSERGFTATVRGESYSGM